jgi:large repetitive protein
MTRVPSLITRVLGTLVVAGVILLGMPMAPASAAPTDHFTIVANNSPVTEGNSGTTAVTFTISYSGPPNAVSVDWTTVDGTATAGNDYVANSGTASFTGTPSDRTKIVTVQVEGDTTYEGNETFTIHLSNPQPAATATIDTANVTQTITDDDTAPSFSIDDVTHDEGDAGGTTYTFTVTKTGSTSLSSSVDYATANGTATTADTDYASTSGTLTFLAGDATKTLDVTVNGDTKSEDDETFFVNLSGATNATISDGQGGGTVTNDDAAPTISVDDQIAGEGDAGTSTMTFHVSLSNPSGQTVTVDYATNDGSATTSDNDYDAASGTLTFDPGDTTKPVDVTISGDTKKEADEDFTLDLSTPSNATISDGSGLGTITNDDPVPDASIADASVAEGDAGTNTLSFDVTLSHPTDDTVTLDWATSDGSATTADDDYVGASGTVTFDPGDTTSTETVDVTVSGDTTYEADEDLTVTLTNPDNAGLADDSGLGTISNDDAVPSISIDDQSADEGDAGTSAMTFHVTLSNPSDQAVTVDYTTTDGTATTLDGDYDTASGTLTFDPGDTTKPVDVTINGDTTYEADEDFTVNLSNESGATLADDSGLGTITNDDPVPSISIDDQSTGEGNTGDNPVLEFNVTLSNPSDQVITVDYTTTDDTATTSDNDYDAASGTVSFDPGDTTKPVDVTVNGDDVPEPDETFTVDLSNESGATLADDSGLGTITNDDAVPEISVTDASVTEGNAGDTTLSFDVTMSQISAGTASVHYATTDDTAMVSDGDYDAANGTVTFDPGQDTKQIDVTVHGDVTYEANETLTVALSSPSGATIDVDTATGTITNDDNPPTLSIDDIQMDEGNSGTTAFTFTVTKTGPTALPASVNWTTGGGDATPTSDYQSGSGTLNFPKATTTRQITVLVNGDTAFEADQMFDVTLSSPSGATISDPTGVGTIKNDDKEHSTLTVKKRLTKSSVMGKGLLERATTGDKVRVSLSRRVHGSWVRIKTKIVTVRRIRDRDGDTIPEGRYRAVFKRPGTHGTFRLRAKFAGSPTQTKAKAKVVFQL